MTYYPCQSCHQWILVAPSTPRAGFLCTKCQPKDSPLKTAVLCVWTNVRPRLRLTVAAVWLVIYLAAMTAMGAAVLLR